MGMNKLAIDVLSGEVSRVECALEAQELARELKTIGKNMKHIVPVQAPMAKGKMADYIEQIITYCDGYRDELFELHGKALRLQMRLAEEVPDDGQTDDSF